METKQRHLEEVRVLNEDIDKCFEQTKTLIENDQFQEAIDALLLLEKRSRIILEPLITKRIAKYITELYYKNKTCKELCSSLVMLSKRRAQSDEVILELVRQCTDYLETFEIDDQFLLIQTLLDISEGKMNIENERTHLILRLVKMKEDQNDIKGAALTSQEVNIEVANTLTSREKAEFLLEQIYLCQLTNDYFRVPIYITKMNRDLLNEENMEDIKKRYLDLCVKQHVFDNDLYGLFKDYEESLTLSEYTLKKGDNEELMAEKDKKRAEQLTYLCLFIILAEHFEEKASVLDHFIQTYKKLLEVHAPYYQLVLAFNTYELIHWPIQNLDVLFQHPIFNDPLFASHSEEWKEQLRVRVIQHNIYVISNEMLQLTPEETQYYITDLVDKHIISLKINQLTNIVEFKANKSPESILNEWSSNTSEIMNLVDKTSLLIENEHMTNV